MTTAVGRALRVLAPNDVKLVWRDSFLLLMIFLLPATGVLLRWGLPYVAEVLAEWVVLEPYYGLIVGFFLVGQEPILLGAVIGFLFVEERDQGTLLALQASPLSLRAFLAYRMLAAMALSIVLSAIGVGLAGLVDVSLAAVLVASALASLTVPIIALVYAVWIQNKVQAVTAIKALQSWALLPALLYFVPTPWPWLGSLAAPLYYPIRLFWSAAEGRPEWWLILPGALLQLAATAWLLRRFHRTAYA